MSTEYILRHCSPTLANLKAGSLFTYKYDSKEQLLKTVKKQNEILNPKGVFMVVLRVSAEKALIYVYRKKQLENILSRSDIRALLSEYGYSVFTIESCLDVLKCRLLLDEFPHEIGVFLGYPLSDICAFIENKGANCPCVGVWKAYTNISEAEKEFKKYKKCTKVYFKCYFNGADLKRLTVAG